MAFAVACNSSDDETTNADSSATSEVTTTSTGTASVQTTAEGKRYVVRTRTGTSSTSGSTASESTGPVYDTVWLWGTEDRYYTLGGGTGRDTLYFNSDEWNTWWNNPETDNELKAKSGKTKVKIDDDGSWKVKDSASKTKMDEDGKVKTKPRKD